MYKILVLLLVGVGLLGATSTASAKKLSPQMLRTQAVAQTKKAEELAGKLEKTWERVHFDIVTKESEAAEKARAEFRRALHETVDAYYAAICLYREAEAIHTQAIWRLSFDPEDKELLEAHRRDWKIVRHELQRLQDAVVVLQDRWYGELHRSLQPK